MCKVLTVHLTSKKIKLIHLKKCRECFVMPENFVELFKAFYSKKKTPTSCGWCPLKICHNFYQKESITMLPHNIIKNDLFYEKEFHV